MCVCATCMWKSEDNLWQSVLSFYHVALKGSSQVIRLDGKPLPSEPS